MKIQTTKNIMNNRLKMVIYGPPGVGKTTLAGTTGEPTLIISAEAGLLCLQGKDIDVIDITTDDAGVVIPKERRMARVAEVYQYLTSKECIDKYRWVFIDSLTEIGQNMVEGLQQEFPDRKDALVLWGEYSKKMKSMIKSFRDLPNYNIVFTALEHTEKDENNARFTGIALQGSIATQLPAYFDEVFYLYVEPTEGKRILITSRTERVLAKDRSGKLEKLEEPNLAKIKTKILTAQTVQKKEK